MKKSRLLGTVMCTCLAVVSFNASAALVSIDWKDAGDALITRDTNTKLNWLDLTETNDMSRDFVLTQLGSGGQFEGFRYATTAEVLALWSNFGIDLSAGGPLFASGFDPGVIEATSFLGNILCELDCTIHPYGVLGITADIDPMGIADHYEWIGAYHFVPLVETTFANDDEDFYSTSRVEVYTGSYLVISQVPLPAAVWLFGTGLLGLVSTARRRNKNPPPLGRNSSTHV